MNHAYLLIGDMPVLEEYLGTLLLRHEVPTRGNPDYQIIEGEVFTVDDARALGDRAREKAFGERKVFVVKSKRFTSEAQNALLKMLEEPSENTHFFILSREESHFLPTVFSRVQTVRVGDAKVSPLHKEMLAFLGALPAKRIELAKKFADKHERSALALFLDALLVELKSQNVSPEVLKKVFTMREFASDPAVMPRLVLEHLAFVV